MAMKNITIVGSGLVGSLLTIYLAKRNYRVNVYERRADMRKQTTDKGRSINLALSDRGLKALSKIGLDEKVKQLAIPMHGRMVHAIDGSTNFQPYGKDGQYINSISRSGLNKLLMDEAEKYTNATIHFNHKSIALDPTTNALIIENELEEQFTTDADLIFSTDGVYSAARNAFQKTERFNYAKEYLEHAYKELSIAADAEGKWQLEKNALHIWPRKNFMLIGLPNLDGTFTLTLFLALKGEYAFEHLQTKETARAFFETYFADALALMPHFDEEFFTNPTSSLVTIKCFPWVYKNKICLLGDAAHAIVPFYGQGMNCGFEDCDVLDDLITQHGEDWQSTLINFQELRKPDADAIAQLALNNFIEMRDLVADSTFLARKKIEATMHSRHPDKFTPLYSLVTFGHTRYSEALRLGNKYNTFFSEKKDLVSLAESLQDENTLAQLDSWVHELQE